MCRKVQALFRGYQTRAHWERTYLRIKRVNEIYQKGIEKAAKMRVLQLKKLFRARFRLWLSNAKELRKLKLISCIKIQTCFRRYRATCLRLHLTQRCRQANRKYIIACELHHSFYLVQLLRSWNAIWFQTRNTRCVNMIKLFLNISSWQVKLKKAGVKLHKFLQIRRKYSNRRVFQQYVIHFSIIFTAL